MMMIHDDDGDDDTDGEVVRLCTDANNCSRKAFRPAATWANEWEPYVSHLSSEARKAETLRLHTLKTFTDTDGRAGANITVCQVLAGAVCSVSMHYRL